MQNNNKDFRKRQKHQDNDINSDMKQIASSFLNRIRSLGKEEDEASDQKRGVNAPLPTTGRSRPSGGEVGGLGSLQQKWNKGEELRKLREDEEERRRREEEEERKRQAEARRRQREKEEKERAEAVELITQLKTECWNRHISYKNTEEEYREFREMFSKSGGILHYVQRFAGLAEYELESFQDLEQLQLKCRDQILSGLSDCIKYRLDKERYDTGGKNAVEFREEAYYENLGIDFNNQGSLAACGLIITALRRKLEIQEQNLKQLYQEYNNYFYKDLWEGMKIKLEELINQKAEAWEELEALKVWIQLKAKELTEQFEKLGVKLIFYKDCPDEKSRDQYIIVLDSCDQVPAVIREKDNFIYFKGRYIIATNETTIE